MIPWLPSIECDPGINLWRDCPLLHGFTATYSRTWVRNIFPLTISDNSSQTSILFLTNAMTLALKVSTNRSSSLTSSGTSDRSIFKSTKRRLPCHFRSHSNLCLTWNSKYLRRWLTVSMRLQSHKGQVPVVKSTKLSACWSRLTHGSWGWLHWLVCCT